MGQPAEGEAMTDHKHEFQRVYDMYGFECSCGAFISEEAIFGVELTQGERSLLEFDFNWAVVVMGLQKKFEVSNIAIYSSRRGGKQSAMDQMRQEFQQEGTWVYGVGGGGAAYHSGGIGGGSNS